MEKERWLQVLASSASVPQGPAWPDSTASSSDRTILLWEDMASLSHFREAPGREKVSKTSMDSVVFNIMLNSL